MHFYVHVFLKNSQDTQWRLPPGRQGSQIGKLQTYFFKPIVWLEISKCLSAFTADVTPQNLTVAQSIVEAKY